MTKIGFPLPESSTASLQKAKLAVMEKVKYVVKSGVMGGPGGGYKYASEGDVIAVIRSAMLESGITLSIANMEVVPDSNQQVTTTSGKQSNIVYVRVRGVFSYGDEHESQCAVGCGMDSGDKAVYKAMTGAYKYILRQYFCLETGDDPDKYPSEDPILTPAERLAEELRGVDAQGLKAWSSKVKDMRLSRSDRDALLICYNNRKTELGVE